MSQAWLASTVVLQRQHPVIIHQHSYDEIFLLRSALLLWRHCTMQDLEVTLVVVTVTPSIQVVQGVNNHYHTNSNNNSYVVLPDHAILTGVYWHLLYNSVP